MSLFNWFIHKIIAALAVMFVGGLEVFPKPRGNRAEQIRRHRTKQQSFAVFSILVLVTRKATD